MSMCVCVCHRLSFTLDMVNVRVCVCVMRSVKILGLNRVRTRHNRTLVLTHIQITMTMGTKKVIYIREFWFPYTKSTAGCARSASFCVYICGFACELGESFVQYIDVPNHMADAGLTATHTWWKGRPHLARWRDGIARADKDTIRKSDKTFTPCRKFRPIVHITYARGFMQYEHKSGSKFDLYTICPRTPHPFRCAKHHIVTEEQ